MILSLIFGVFLVLFFCVCYAVGGQGPKWVRRFLGAGIFGAGIILMAVLKKHFGVLSLLAGAWYIPSLLIFKYGVNDGNIAKKIALRAVYGASLGLPGLLMGIAGHHIVLGFLQLILAITGSVYFGVVNPFSKYGDKGVMAEDFCIALCAVAMVPFIV